MSPRRRETPMTDEDRKFYAGFVDILPDEQKRKNRRSSIENALRDIRGTLGAMSQGRTIREPNNEDARVHTLLVQAVALLDEALR